ncbi:MAG: helix-turn-helix domain-containing protein [Myxococcota bacterium]|jgi:AcrR family transcriptional regulator|nr:helix-turn-helix domain-containing protein [Myxococcota bacterium]
MGTAERGSDARKKLIDAARDLFAERGIEGVSLRELTRAAGQANTSALQYHFGDREGLLHAVLEPHQTRVDARRAMLLEDLEARDPVELRDLAGALVRPSAAMLEEAGGKAYLRIVAELNQDPGRFKGTTTIGQIGLKRWTDVARAHMPDAVSPLHRRFAAAQLCFSELGRRASTRRRGDHRLFVSDLVDLTTAILAAPVSSETQRLLTERDASASRKRARS